MSHYFHYLHLVPKINIYNLFSLILPKCPGFCDAEGGAPFSIFSLEYFKTHFFLLRIIMNKTNDSMTCGLKNHINMVHTTSVLWDNIP